MIKGTLYRPYMAATTLVYVPKERFVAFGDRLELHFCGLHIYQTYIPLWLIHAQITSLSNVSAKGASIGKAYFPLERRFFIWDFANAVPNAYAIPWWPNQFCTFSVHFVRNVWVHSGLIWPLSNKLIWTSKSASCEIRCSALIGYKECNVTNFVSNQSCWAQASTKCRGDLYSDQRTGIWKF